MDSQATAGRIVHYYSMTDDGRGPHAAIVCRNAFPDGTADLHVFGGSNFTPNVRYSESPHAGHWSWMPYQKAKAETAEGNQSESAEPRP